MTGEGLWTVDEACGWFASQGDHADPAQLRAIIRALHWLPAGEAQAGPKGGRGHALYPIRALMDLHKAVTELGRHATRPAGS
jgi:hypothetical protein